MKKTPRMSPKAKVNYAIGMKIRDLIEENFKVKGAFSGYESDPMHGTGRWSTIKLVNGITIRYSAPWFTCDESKDIYEDQLRANTQQEE